MIRGVCAGTGDRTRKPRASGDDPYRWEYNDLINA